MQKYQGFGLVRDKVTGKPRVDNPTSLHPVQILLMTPDERRELGVWEGAWARDAQGFKRLTCLPDGTFRAEEPIVAVNEILVGENQFYPVLPRCDIPAGETITIEYGAD
jgi:hypothetical protein